MNVENILKVADAIEQHTIPDLGFNLTYYSADIAKESGDDVQLIDHSGHSCGTVACIAGYCAALRTGDANDAWVLSEAKFLGITYSKGEELFGCNMAERDRNKITSDQAVRTLRHLAATGEVDWSIEP